MSLLATAAAIDLLKETADMVGPGGRLKQRFASIQGVFSEELAYLESELVSAAAAGASPGTLAAKHLVSAGGKRIRPLTVLLSAACFGAIPQAARELAVVAELVHSATLLHDDVIDDSPERRGLPAARKVWGNAVSVLAGDLLLTHALDRTLAAAPLALPDLLVTLRRLVDGEIMQLRGRATLDATEADLLSGSSRTRPPRSSVGRPARAPSPPGPGTSERQALGMFGERLGVAFQLVDDALDYAGDSAETGKALLADLIEGQSDAAAGAWLSPTRSELGRICSTRRATGTARPQRAWSSGRVDGRLRRSATTRRDRDRARARGSLRGPSASPAREMLRVLSTELTTRTAYVAPAGCTAKRADKTRRAAIVAERSVGQRHGRAGSSSSGASSATWGESGPCSTCRPSR